MKSQTGLPFTGFFIQECFILGEINGDLKYDIDTMVSELDIDNNNKTKLRKTIKRFGKGLFGGGFGCLTSSKKAHVKLKPGAILYSKF